MLICSFHGTPIHHKVFLLRQNSVSSHHRQIPKCFFTSCKTCVLRGHSMLVTLLNRARNEIWSKKKYRFVFRTYLSVLLDVGSHQYLVDEMSGNPAVNQIFLLIHSGSCHWFFGTTCPWNHQSFQSQVVTVHFSAIVGAWLKTIPCFLYKFWWGGFIFLSKWL